MVPFFGNKEDRELIKVIRYLNRISKCPDLRIPNEKAFQLTKIYRSRIENFIKYYDFNKISDDETNNTSESISQSSHEEDVEVINEESATGD